MARGIMPNVSSWTLQAHACAGMLMLGPNLTRRDDSREGV